MVVTFVLKANVPSEFTIEQYKEKLEKRIEALKPDKTSPFQVQVVVYQSTAQQQQQNMVSLNQFLHSDYPATCFSMFENTANEAKVLTGDIGLASIQRRLGELGVLSEKKKLNMDCLGTAYKIGDFQIKIGSVVYSSTNRGLLCEISYSWGTSNFDTFGLLNEFTQSVFGWNLQEKTGSPVDVLTSYIRRKPSQAVHFPEDVILQYFEHFNNFRSANMGK